MAAKAVLVFCAQTLLAQFALSQCISRAAIEAPAIPAGAWTCSNFAAANLDYNNVAPFAYEDLSWTGRNLACEGYPALNFAPTSGGSLPVTSISPISPTGIYVISDNAYEGLLYVVGELPFLGAVVVEGTLPSAGSGAINYACGNGVTAMTSEGIVPAGYGPGYGAGYGPAGFGPASYGPAGFGPASYGPAGFGPAGFGPAGYGPVKAPGRLGGRCGLGMLY